MTVQETVVEWFTRKDTSYLFGAGCSACANKPLVAELTQKVLAEQTAKLASLFSSLTASAGRYPHIEDLMNFLLRLRYLSQSSSIPILADWASSDVDDAINQIRLSIVRNIADAWLPSDHHAAFLKRICNSTNGRNFFVLNYDTVLEATLEELRISYTDGFRGAERAYFDPSLFIDHGHFVTSAKIFKLHGSVNWIRELDGVVRRIAIASRQTDGERVVVYPSEQKYVQTQFGVYEHLMTRFRDHIRGPSRNNMLICLGYSFNDEHINEAICDAASSSASNLTVIGFIGSEADLIAQQGRLEAIAARCPSQISFYVGNKFFTGDALSLEDSNTLLKMDLWKFENIAKLLGGE